MDVTSEVIQQYKDLPLLEYLTKRFTYLSHKEWSARISERRLTINGVVGGVADVVRQCDRVTYDMPDFIEPSATLNYTIVYENEFFLAVNKPGNLLVHKHGRSFKSNLIYQLREVHTSSYPTADIVNRLDRDTSGLVLISKSKEILRELQGLFVERKITKVYQAVVEGIMYEDSGFFDTPIGSLRETSVRQKQGVDTLKPKEAITDFKVLSRSATRTLLELRLHTGRTHQLRVHCALAGYPMTGDALYTLSEEEFSAYREGDLSIYEAPFERQALHCTELHFAWRGEQYDLEAPLPESFLTLMEGVKITQ